MENPQERIQLVLASNIKSARRRLRFSQQELAERADLSPGHMNDLEQGRKWVSAASLQRIADALLLEPWMLLYKEDDRPENFTRMARFRDTLVNRMAEAVDSSIRDCFLRSHSSSPRDWHRPRFTV